MGGRIVLESFAHSSSRRSHSLDKNRFRFASRFVTKAGLSHTPLECTPSQLMYYGSSGGKLLLFLSKRWLLCGVVYVEEEEGLL